MSAFFTGLLASLSQNGKPHDEDDSSAMNGDGPRMRHRGHTEGDDPPASGGDTAKPYTSEQLDAVKKSVGNITHS